MRRAWSIVSLSILLAGCGSNGGPTALCSQQFWNGTIGTCLPEGWSPLGSEELRNQGVPEETVLAFQSNDARDGQFDTVTVTEEPLPQDMSSLEYGEANILAVSALPDYDLKDKRTLTIDEQDAILHVFAARPTPDTPIRRYYQVSITEGRTGYTFTGSLPLTIQSSDENPILSILSNATLTDPNPSSEENQQ